MEYKIVDKEDGEIRVGLGDYSILQMYYNGDRAHSPFDRDEAMKLTKLFVGFLENSVDPSTLDVEEYTSKRGDMMEAFFKHMLKEMGGCDSNCDCE